MKQINYSGSSKLISRIVNLLNRKAPLPLDGDGDPSWGAQGQVLSTDGNGNTAWVNQGGGGGDVTDVEVNGTSVVNAQGVAEVSVPTKTSDLNNDSDFVSDASYVHTDNNYTNADSTKLSGIAAGAEVNVQADWNETDNTSDAYIANKPSIPAAQIQSDWSQNDSSAVDFIKNKPTIPSSSGHTIWNRIKTALTARANLWFKDANVSDESTDGATAVEVVTELQSESAFDNLATDGTADGVYVFPDSGDEYLDAYMVGYRNGSVGDALDDKVSKSGDTITGTLKISNSSNTDSLLELGRSNSHGVLRLYDSGSGYRANLYTANGLTGNRTFVLPNKDGTLLLDTDIRIVKAQSGSSNNAVITVPSAYPYATFEIVTPLMFYVGSCGSSGAVSNVKGLDGTTPTVSGNNVTVYVGSYYKTAVLRLYPSAAF